MVEDNHSLSQWVGNGVSVGAIVSSWAGYLPTIAAVVASFIAAVWYIIQIYESATVQRWVALRRTRKLALLKARVILMEAQGKHPLPGPESGGAALH